MGYVVYVLLLSLAALAHATPVNYFFGGLFTGYCGPDGYYYVDADTFVQCSGGRAYHQKCAGGTENSPLQFYKSGYYKEVKIFCDVNKNDALNAMPNIKDMDIDDEDMDAASDSAASAEDAPAMNGNAVETPVEEEQVPVGGESTEHEAPADGGASSMEGETATDESASDEMSSSSSEEQAAEEEVSPMVNHPFYPYFPYFYVYHSDENKGYVPMYAPAMMPHHPYAAAHPAPKGQEDEAMMMMMQHQHHFAAHPVQKSEELPMMPNYPFGAYPVPKSEEVPMIPNYPFGAYPSYKSGKLPMMPYHHYGFGHKVQEVAE